MKLFKNFRQQFLAFAALSAGATAGAAWMAAYVQEPIFKLIFAMIFIAAVANSALGVMAYIRMLRAERSLRWKWKSLDRLLDEEMR